VGKDPESTGGLTYDAIQLFVQALQNCGELTGDLAKATWPRIVSAFAMAWPR